MDNIVYDFANITFQPKEVGFTGDRSSTSSNLSWRLKEMAMSDMEEMRDASESVPPPPESDDNVSSESNESDDVDSQLSRCEDNDDDSDCISGSSSHSSNFGARAGVARRRMPARVSKDNFNRVCSAIMKPIKKKQRKELSANAQTLKSIEKLYTSKRMKKFTPTNLETIFEEPSDENAADAEDDSEECSISSQVRIVKFGGRKLRRAISFSDGLNKNKILSKKRRQKVKKTFGKRFALKKISMTEFHDRLNKSFDSAMLEGDEGEPPGSGEAHAEMPKTSMTMEDIQLPAMSGQQHFLMQPAGFE
ncbi:protein tantalus [Drosophila gunungcola]|uniref:protein tantalus n=1 Tax=Drosophila gunungcola TaxID=103775 RepID=UPI0022E50DB1|nr:protein tantalus [Drosophila gunungcola]XP_052846461.1 protein tantalus [Drosophila gunungcola]XP_052846462.1 protein tantalus [Drosophila gunungcola]